MGGRLGNVQGPVFVRRGGFMMVATVTQTMGKPYDPIAALAFIFGVIVVVASLGSLLLTLLAVVGVPL